MHRNIFWVGFLVIVIGLSLWFVLRAGAELLDYYRLSNEIPVSIDKWTIIERKADRYALSADFTFDFQGKIYRGSGELRALYPNPWAANKALEKHEKKNWTVWLSAKNPSQAVLEKKFPLKKSVSALVLLGLTIYFISLGFYVRTKFEKKSIKN